MTITITHLGHSGFVFDDGSHQIAIDPFLTGNPLAKNQPDDVTCQHVLPVLITAIRRAILTNGNQDR